MLESAQGVIRLEPVPGKLGSLPIPRTTLDHIVQQLSNSLQNRNNIELRPQMASV